MGATDGGSSVRPVYTSLSCVLSGRQYSDLFGGIAGDVRKSNSILRLKSVSGRAHLLSFSPSNICALARTNISALAHHVTSLSSLTQMPAGWLRVGLHLEERYDVIQASLQSAMFSAQHESALLTTDHGPYPNNVFICRSPRNKL